MLIQASPYVTPLTATPDLPLLPSPFPIILRLVFLWDVGRESFTPLTRCCDILLPVNQDPEKAMKEKQEEDERKQREEEKSKKEEEEDEDGDEDEGDEGDDDEEGGTAEGDDNVAKDEL